MQTNKSLLDEIKHIYLAGNATIKLIFINVSVFLLVQILLAIDRLTLSGIGHTILELVSLNCTWRGLVFSPWGLFTNIFVHENFFHLVFNMFFLYFAGTLFESIFDRKRLIYTYIFGGIFGGILEVISHYTFPGLESGGFVLGASGAIMAIFVAIAFYSPNTKVLFFGVYPIPIYVLALLFLLKDIMNVGTVNQIAHFAHIGGAIFGMVSANNIHSKNNIMNFLYRLFGSFGKLFTSRQPKKTAPSGKAWKSDEQYNVDKKKRQQKTDAILDKISKSGYESLTREEKDFLFNQSKNG